MIVKPIPNGYHSITPYLIINKAAEAIAFYKRAFSAIELFRMDMPDGKVGHAEIQIGDSRIMMADDCGEESPFRNPQSSGSSAVGLHLYVNDVDAVFTQAVEAGARVIKPVEDQFYGVPVRRAARPVRAYLVRRNAQGRLIGRSDQAASRGKVREDGTAA